MERQAREQGRPAGGPRGIAAEAAPGLPARPAAAAWQALRPHQWVKNALLFVPVVLAHRVVDDPARVAAVAAAFAAMCAAASASYLWNDWLDREADRGHPEKRHRPLASGALTPGRARGLGLVLVAIAIGLPALLLTPAVTGMIAGYLVISGLYSWRLKQFAVIDVGVLAGLYTHRVLTGGVAADVPISPWLLVFSLFFFLSLALVKRYAELLGARGRALERLPRRGYRVADRELLGAMGVASGFVAVLVVGLYVSSEDVRRLYPTPGLLWAVCPVLLYWLARIWLLARRGALSEDPVFFAATDRASYAAGALIVAVGVLASVPGLFG